MGEYYFSYFIGLIISSIIWGIIVNKVIKYRGFDENWFWWGFFFGIIALVFAILKTNGRIVSYNSNTYGSSLENAANEREEREKLKSGYWKCNSCGSNTANVFSSLSA